MAQSSQTNPTSLRVLPLHEAPLPQTVFVDRDGDTWVPAGHTTEGELLLACPEPQNPGDQGDGPSHPWTLAKVEAAFGPLTPRADVEERRLVEVDEEFTGYFGPMWREWQPWQVAQYLDALAKVHAEFAPEGVAA
jgi:hypothetical protein